MSSEEYVPLAWNRRDQCALEILREVIPKYASGLRLALPEYVASRRGLAATLRSIDQTNGGGFYDIPREAEWDERVADACFADDDVVVDVQTHMVNRARLVGGTADRLRKFLQNINPEQWGRRSGGDRRQSADRCPLAR
jgi:hypothetical protein